MLKKLSAILLAVVMCGSLSACGNGGNGADEGLTATHTLSRGDKGNGEAEAETTTSAAEDKKGEWVLIDTQTWNAERDEWEDGLYECICDELQHSYREARTDKYDIKYVSTCTAPPQTVPSGGSVSFDLTLELTGESETEYSEFVNITCDPADIGTAYPSTGYTFVNVDEEAGYNGCWASTTRDDMKYVFSATVRNNFPLDEEYLGDKLALRYSSNGCETRWVYEFRKTE